MLLGAASRILMAYMEPQELERVLKVNTAGVDGFDRAAFDREIARARRQGYAISRGTRVPASPRSRCRSSTSQPGAATAWPSRVPASASIRATSNWPTS